MLYVIICLFQIEFERRDKFADNFILRKNIVNSNIQLYKMFRV